MSFDWPAGLERTPAGERKQSSSFRATLGATTKELEKELRLMDVDEWRVETGSGGSHTKQNGLPKASANPDDPSVVLRWTMDVDPFAVGCDTYTSLRDNCREILLWLNETRMRDQREVATGRSGYAAAALPSGDDVVVAGVEESAHEVLGIAPDADEERIRSTARAQKAASHPDTGGSSAEFKRVVEAEEAMLDE